MFGFDLCCLLLSPDDIFLSAYMDCSSYAGLSNHLESSSITIAFKESQAPITHAFFVF